MSTSPSSSLVWRALAEAHRGAHPGLNAAFEAWALCVAEPPDGEEAPRTDALRTAWTRVRYEVAYAVPREAAPLAEADVARARAGEGDLGSSLLVFACARGRKGDLRGALLLLAEAIEGARSAGDEELRLSALADRGLALSVLGERVLATVDIVDALQLTRELGNRRVEALLLGRLGFLHGRQDEPLPYELHTRAALEIYRELGDRKGISHSLCNMGGALARMGRREEAEACYLEGMPIALELGWRYGEALFLAGLGGLRCEAGRFDEGLGMYCFSNALLAPLGEHFQVARHELIVGRYLVEARRFEDALPHLGEAIARAEANEWRPEAAEGHLLLSRAFEGMGDYHAAFTSLQAHLGALEASMEERIAQRIRTVELRLEAEAAARAGSSVRAAT
ncbi:MAG: hypothetical protein Q8P18_06840 [Pseudomonadota bacterium]|nr:hypothetical protein [Pseudomonadota bacterium]